MDKNIDKTRLIDYLYGELSDQEHAEVKQLIDNSEELSVEVNHFNSVRTAIGDISDKETIVPTFILGNEPRIQVSFVASSAFRWTASVAASLLLLIFSAALLKVNFVQNKHGMVIGFGTQIPVTEDVINKENIKSWMQSALAEQQLSNEARIDDVEKKLTSQMRIQDEKNLALMNSMMNKYSDGANILMQEYVAQLNNENKEIIQNYFAVSSTQQKNYVKSVLADFNEFYQNQRAYDLKMIERSISNVKVNHEVKQIEQDQLLANLYDIMNTQNK